jgi:hypothetical protein
MDNVIQRVIADLLALSKDMDGQHAARIAQIIERLLRDQDPHGQHAARLYGQLEGRPLPRPARSVSSVHSPATQAE